MKILTDYSAKTRKSKTTKYKKQLTALFSEADENNKKAADILISRAAFLLASLDELEQTIYERGYIEYYQNGANQKGQMVSPALKTYKMNMSQVLDIMKQLQTYLPESVEVDELTEFTKQHNKM